MNVLEQEDQDRNTVVACKTAYLRDENSWMREEYDFLSSIVSLFKQILQQPASASQFYTSLNQLIQERVSLHHRKLSLPLDSTERIPVTAFLEMVCSFEQRLKGLRVNIKERESQLQVIEKRKIAGTNTQPEEKVSFRLIHNYDITTKMLEKAKRDLIHLKNQKKKIEMKLCDSPNESLNEVKSTTTVVDEEPLINEPVNLFEQTVAVYKKKKMENEQLLLKIAEMKRSAKERETVNKRLSQQVEQMEWMNLDGCEYTMGVAYPFECPYGDQLSILGRTLQNNYDLSIDISRFVKLPPKGK